MTAGWTPVSAPINNNMPYKDKIKQNEFQLNRMRNFRIAWLTSNGLCVKCGSNERLEVDHIDPSTKVSHKVWSWSQEKRNIELAKCQVLCYNCHMAKSIAEKSRPITHGILQGYNRGCRCVLCKEIKSSLTENVLYAVHVKR